MMRLQRVHTRPGRDVFEGLALRKVQAEGSAAEYAVPAAWEPAAADVLAEKIFHKHPLPPATGGGEPYFETCVTEVIARVAGGLAQRAEDLGLFADAEEAGVFTDELRYILLHRLATFDVSLWAAAGGGTRRAASPVSSLAEAEAEEKRLRLEGEPPLLLMHAENPDSTAFIRRAAALKADRQALEIGRRLLSVLLHRVMDACDRDAEEGFDPEENYALKRAVNEARKAGVEDALIADAISYARQGFEEIPLPRADETEGDSGVIAETVISLPDVFVESALTGHGFPLSDGRRAAAEKMWDSLSDAIWTSSSPCVLFRDTAEAAGFAGGLAPDATGGLLFRPGAEAPGATLDLARLDAGTLPHTAAIMTIALEAAALGDCRPVVLGFTNLAAFLMKRGLAYDSDEGRATAGLAAALVSSAALRASAAMAGKAGPFPAWPAHEKAALLGLKSRLGLFSGNGWTPEGLMRRPWRCDAALCPDKALAAAAQDGLARAYVEVKASGLRNAHLTGIGRSPETEALLGAETPGIAPMETLMRFGSDGGLYARALAPAAIEGLRALGKSAREIDDIAFHVLGHATLLDAPFIHHAALRRKGFHQGAIDALEAALKTARHIRHAFSRWTLGAEFCAALLGIEEHELDAPGFDMLEALGFSEGEIRAANLYCCGAGTFADAPHLDARARAVFDTAVSPDAQVRMQAAVEPFLSGAAAHVIRLDAGTGIDAVQKLLLRGWELGVKTMRLHRHPALLVPAEAAEALEAMPVPAPLRQTVGK